MTVLEWFLWWFTPTRPDPSGELILVTALILVSTWFVRRGLA